MSRRLDHLLLDSDVVFDKLSSQLHVLKSKLAKSREIHIDLPNELVENVFQKSFSCDKEAIIESKLITDKLRQGLSDLGTPMDEDEVKYISKKALNNDVDIDVFSFQDCAHEAHRLHFLSNLFKEAKLHLAFEKYAPRSVKAIYDLSENQLVDIITNMAFASEVAKQMFSCLRKRTRACTSLARTLNSKFVSDGADFCDFGDDEDFHGGLERSIGLPDPCVMKAIFTEHLHSVHSDKSFITTNYHSCTSPQIELAFIVGRPEDASWLKSVLSQQPLPPTPDELVALEKDFTILQRISREVADCETGKFPGEIGDWYNEVLITLSVQLQPKFNSLDSRTRLTKYLTCALEDLPSSLRPVRDENRLRLDVLFVTESSSSPKYACLALPLRAEQFTPLRREAVVAAVAQAWGLSESVEVLDVQERTWRYVEHPSPDVACERQGRKRLPMRELMERPEVTAAGLRVEEVMIANDYTGPMFMVFNRVLRASQSHSNKFTTSLHCLASAAIKLARVACLPRDRRLWRGLGSHVLQESRFFEPDKRGTKGGVERGFLSTTTKLNVAMQYSGHTQCCGTVLEIDFGKVDCPAQLDSLSQYPGEGEMLFGPLSYLEAVGCPRLEPFQGSTVLVVPVRINCNLKTLTIEETIAKRKRFQLNMIDSLVQEVYFDFTALPDEVLQDNRKGNPHRVLLSDDLQCCVTVAGACSLQPTLDQAAPPDAETGVDPILGAALATMKQLRLKAEKRLEAWFNQDENFRTAWNEALDTKNKIRSSWWLRSLLKDSSIDDFRRMLSTYEGLYSMDSLTKQASLEAKEIGLFNSSPNETNQDGETLMMTSATEGSWVNVRLLALAGASVNAQDSKGKTALHAAVENYHPKVVQCLVALKADLNQDGRQIVSVLKHAERKVTIDQFHPHPLWVFKQPSAKCDHCLKPEKGPMVYRCNACNYNLCMACFNKSEKSCLREFKLLGVDGWTPLMMAAEEGNHAELQRLLADQPLVNATNCQGETAAHMAAARCNLEALRLLCNAGADVDAEDRAGVSVCDLMRGECARGMRAERGWTPLMLAVEEGDAVQIKQLIEERADLGARNQSLRTALHVAARCGQLEVLQLLLDAGADVNSVDDKGRSALSLVKGKECRSALLAAGADGWDVARVQEENARVTKILTADIELLGGRLPQVGVVALFFGFQQCGACMSFIPRLVQLYQHLRTSGQAFEVIYISSDQLQAQFVDFYDSMPWLAIPFEEDTVRDALFGRYRIQWVPLVVLLEAETGEVICRDAGSEICDDPIGNGFPWREQNIEELLGTSFLLGGTTVELQLAGKYVGIFFAGRWCPACQRALPLLVQAYQAVRKTRDDLEIVFCSSDQDQAMFDTFYADMPWLAFPFADRTKKASLSRRYSVQGIPTFILITPERKELQVRITGSLANTSFPWYGQPALSF